MTDRPPAGRRRIYVDRTHLRGHVTGIERVTLDLFGERSLAPHDVRWVSSRNLPGMIARQQVGLPLALLRDPEALFVFPGFPPGPLCAAAAERCLLYIHDTFLLTRPEDLSLRSRLYMSPSFALAMRWGRHLFVNSRTTGEDVRRFCRASATVSLLRPHVRDVFGLSGRVGPGAYQRGEVLRILAVGTIEPRKNYPASLAIVEALIRAGMPAELHLVGRPGWGHHPFLEAPPPFLHLHGYLSDAELRALSERCHLFLSTSKAEGLGLPLLEVQHGALPVAAPEQPVFREVLGTSGMLIDPADPRFAAAALGEWVVSGDFAGAAAASRANVARWNALADADAVRFRRFLDGDAHAYSEPGTRIP